MKSEKGKMKNQGNELSERLLDFATAVIKLVVKLNKNSVGRHIGDQLMRSATSSGANYEEACGAESRADFIHKTQIVLKELKESLYWLMLVEKSALISDEVLRPILREGEELVRIIAKSVITAKSNKEI